MADKFEHQIADQVSGFQLTPSSQVWKGVVMELDKEKSKKPIFLWWILSSFLGIGIAVYFLTNAKQAHLQPNTALPNTQLQKTLPNSILSTNASVPLKANNHVKHVAGHKNTTNLLFVPPTPTSNEVLPILQIEQPDQQNKDSKKIIVVRLKSCLN